MTASILPMRPKESAGYYGAEVKYLVKLVAKDGYKKTIPVYFDDYNYPRFEEFRLTEEALSSSENLQKFLTEQAVNGTPNCIDVKVVDADGLRKKNYGPGFEEVFEAKHHSWIFYVVVGKLLTILGNIRLYFWVITNTLVVLWLC